MSMMSQYSNSVEVLTTIVVVGGRVKDLLSRRLYVCLVCFGFICVGVYD